MREYDFDSSKLLRRTHDISVYTDNALRQHRRFVRKGHSFLFTGHNSTGKTHVALWLLGKFAACGYTIHYYKFKRYLSHILNAFTDVEQRRFLDEAAQVDLLCLDEVGKESSATPQVIGEFEELIKYRQDNKKPTILITNLTMDLFRSRYDESIYEALAEKFVVIMFDLSNNFRLKNRRLDYLRK